MTTINPYNHTAKLLMNGEVSLADLKVMLVDGTTGFSAAHTTLAQATDAGADEVDGAGWDTGGEALAGAAITIVSTSGAMLDATDISVTATAGNIGPAEGAIIYDDDHTDDAPLFYIDFEEEKTADEGTDFKITFDANGIARAAWS